MNYGNYHFLIESYIDDFNNKVPLFSFGYEIINSIKENKWIDINSKYSYELVLLNDLNNYSNKVNKVLLNIPIGSVEFVNFWLNKINKKQPLPLNVPIHLRNNKFVGRKILDISYNEFLENIIKFYNNFYVKSADEYKHFDIIRGKYYLFFCKDIKVNNLFISEQINQEIKTEFRCFVLSNKIVSIKPYINDICYTIDNKHVELLNEIINTNISNNLNVACYTIDYAILEDGSFELIELHHPYSVGNYGFNGIELLLFYLRGYLELIK